MTENKQFIVYGPDEGAVPDDVIAEAANYACAGDAKIGANPNGNDGVSGGAEPDMIRGAAGKDAIDHSASLVEITDVISDGQGDDGIIGTSSARDFVAEGRKHTESPRNAPRRAMAPHPRNR